MDFQGRRSMLKDIADSLGLGDAGSRAESRHGSRVPTSHGARPESRARRGSTGRTGEQPMMTRMDSIGNSASSSRAQSRVATSHGRRGSTGRNEVMLGRLGEAGGEALTRSMTMRAIFDTSLEELQGLQNRPRLSTLTRTMTPPWTQPNLLFNQQPEKVPILSRRNSLSGDSEMMEKIRTQAEDLSSINELELRAGIAGKTLWDLLEPLVVVVWRLAAEVGQAGSVAQELLMVKSEVVFLREQLKLCNASAMREISNLRARQENMLEKDEDDDLEQTVGIQFHDPISFMDEKTKKLMNDIIKVKELEWMRAHGASGTAEKCGPSPKPLSPKATKDEFSDTDSDDDSFFPNASRPPSKNPLPPANDSRAPSRRGSAGSTGSNVPIVTVREVGFGRRGSSSRPVSRSALRLTSTDRLGGDLGEVLQVSRCTTPSASAGRLGSRDRPTTAATDASQDSRLPLEPGSLGDTLKEDGTDAANSEDDRRRSSGANGAAAAADAAATADASAAASDTAGKAAGGKEKRKSVRRTLARRSLVRSRGSTFERMVGDDGIAEGPPSKTIATQTQAVRNPLEEQNRRLQLALEEMRMKLSEFMGSCDDHGIGEEVCNVADEVGMSDILGGKTVYERLYEDALKRPARLEELLHQYFLKAARKAEAEDDQIKPVSIVEAYLSEYPLRLWPKAVKEEEMATNQSPEPADFKPLCDVGNRIVRMPGSDLGRGGGGSPSCRREAMSRGGHRPSTSMRPDSALSRGTSVSTVTSPAGKRPETSSAGQKPLRRAERPMTTAGVAISEQPSPEETRRVASFLKQRRRMQSSDSEDGSRHSSKGKPAEAKGATVSPKGALANPSVRAVLGLTTVPPPQIAEATESFQAFKRKLRQQVSLPAL